MLPRIACIVLATVVLFFGVGCANDRRAPERPAGNVNFYDQTGEVVATGNLREVPELTGNADFTARWHLIWSRPGFPTGAMADGRVTGRLEDGRLSINLHPPVADNNIVLIGTLINGGFAGTWHLSTLGGGNPMGRFEAFLAR